MNNLHYRPAPHPESLTAEDRMVFPVRKPAAKLRLAQEEAAMDDHQSLEDTGLWMDAIIDDAQDRIDTLRSLLDSESDDDGPRAA